MVFAEKKSIITVFATQNLLQSKKLPPKIDVGRCKFTLACFR